MKKQKIRKSMEKSIDSYGHVQLLMVCEEMAELIQAISKMERLMDAKDKNHKHKQHIIEEIADVEIMLDELLLYYNIKREDVNKVKSEKIERLKKRMYSRKD
jgi:NTP pyrophosphatase (non-canonical NTP hydrolase)